MSKYTISKLEDGCKQILKEIKKQKTYVNEVENENIYLQNELDNANSKITELSNRILKAIEFINSQSPDAGVCGKTIKKILKGSDK